MRPECGLARTCGTVRQEHPRRVDERELRLDHAAEVGDRLVEVEHGVERLPVEDEAHVVLEAEGYAGGLWALAAGTLMKTSAERSALAISTDLRATPP